MKENKYCANKITILFSDNVIDLFIDPMLDCYLDGGKTKRDK